MVKFFSGALLSGLIGILGLIIAYQSWQIEKQQLERQIANDLQTLVYQNDVIDRLRELGQELSLLAAIAEDRNAILQIIVDTLKTNALTPEEIAKLLETTEKSREKQLGLVVELQNKARELELGDVENTLEAVRKLLGNPHSSSDSSIPKSGTSVPESPDSQPANPGQRDGVPEVPSVPSELPPTPGDGPKGNVILCIPTQSDSYVKIYRLVHAGKNSKGETLVKWERWDKHRVNYGSRGEDGSIKIDGVPVNVAVFGDEGEPYKIELYVEGKLKDIVGDILAGQEPFLIMPARDNFVKQWSAPC